MLTIILAISVVFGVGVGAGKDVVRPGMIRQEVKAWKAEMVDFELRAAKSEKEFLEEKIRVLSGDGENVRHN